MGECRGGGDCLIKLFGATIPVPEAGDVKDHLHNSGSSNSSSSTESDGVKEDQHQDTLDPPPQPEVVDAEDPKSSLVDCPGNDDDEANPKEKLKKPDKVLPCPRCNSMDTKFCYFNNYNVNQPRHFCKNCQRYWTAGGAMRNVPVGAGRRKNKNAVAASHFLQRVRAAAGDPLKTNGGTVLSFGHGPALQDLAGQVGHHLKKNHPLVPIANAGHHRPCTDGSSNREEDMSLSGIITNKEKGKPAAINGMQHHPANMNGAGATAWPYSCAPPSPAYYPPPGIAFPIYPGYWGCMVPGGWSLPWPVQSSSPTTTQSLSSPPTSCAPSVSSSGADDSLALGKHARETDDEGRRSSYGGKVWAPKTIRIDDADSVARSSIWSLIGVKGGDKQQNADHLDGRKHGTVFEPKQHESSKTAMITSSPSPLLHVNPVALTRSLTFQEGS